MSVTLTAGRDGRARQTLLVSSGTDIVFDGRQQLDRLFYQCNNVTRAHTMTTVFAGEIDDGARWEIVAESRFDLPAGLTDQQLVVLLLNTSKWNAELCLTLAQQV